ncbi:serine hydrolase-like protein isoform X2 [Ictalurus punctatus]|uniref:Serine hydrolase-like protein isoform X2 n=1 Tax=Ictalurus punctatus TaxID=7998 RepID=A0A2D0Q7V1_ICTPU|nr:serine hydrolase-like protein isoform X2 [Ictalurus punctatus]
MSLSESGLSSNTSLIARCRMIQTLKSVRHLAMATMKQRVTEFRMSVPWGEMRGQAWGPNHGRPVLCLHGWSDNSGSFKTLIPLLPADWRCVAVDLPGHGFSSHRPAGVFYTFPAYIADIRRVIEALQWKRFSIIGHSMGGNIGGMFCALYPDMVDALVLMDSYGYLPVDVKRMSRITKRGIEEMIEYEKKLPERKERIYTYEKAKERLKTANEFLSDESVEILLERGVQKADGGVVFTRDIRLNLTNIFRNSLEQCLEFQSQINAKVLILRASEGLQKTLPQPEEIAVPLLKGWSERQSTIVTVEGDHHVHLNNPELVAPIITDFLLSQTSQHNANASDFNQAPKL